MATASARRPPPCPRFCNDFLPRHYSFSDHRGKFTTQLLITFLPFLRASVLECGGLGFVNFVFVNLTIQGKLVHCTKQTQVITKPSVTSPSVPILTQRIFGNRYVMRESPFPNSFGILVRVMAAYLCKTCHYLCKYFPQKLAGIRFDGGHKDKLYLSAHVTVDQLEFTAEIYV